MADSITAVRPLTLRLGLSSNTKDAIAPLKAERWKLPYLRGENILSSNQSRAYCRLQECSHPPVEWWRTNTDVTAGVGAGTFTEKLTVRS